MASYELHTVPRHGRQRTGSVAFAASGVRQALGLADRLAGEAPVELWEGERLVCRLQRSPRACDEAGFWMVS